jgi:hypothetical protein
MMIPHKELLGQIQEPQMRKNKSEIENFYMYLPMNGGESMTEKVKPGIACFWRRKEKNCISLNLKKICNIQPLKYISGKTTCACIVT